MATRWALDHVLGGVPLEELAVADFAWRPGWEYRLPTQVVEVGGGRAVRYLGNYEDYLRAKDAQDAAGTLRAASAGRSARR